VLPVVVVVVVAGVLVAIVIGGILETGSASRPYQRSVNRSFAASGTLVVDRSNATGDSLRSALAQMPGAPRLTAQRDLDSLVTAATAEQSDGAALVPPDPSGTVGPQFAAVLAARARAVGSIRATVDGLLGMAPFPVVGAPPGSWPAAGGPGPSVLSATEASAALTAAGAVLRQADATYAALRRELATAPGRNRLPASVWVPDPSSWSAGVVDALVSQLSGSPSLAVSHDLQIVTVAIEPPAVPSVMPNTVSAVPPPPGTCPSSSPSTVPPSATLHVTVTVANDGNVTESRVPVTLALAPTAGGSGQRSTTIVSLLPGASTVVAPPSFGIRDGRSYTLTVSAPVPSAQTSPTCLTQTFPITVAPGTPSSPLAG
jgi:hypothetical protein